MKKYILALLFCLLPALVCMGQLEPLTNVYIHAGKGIRAGYNPLPGKPGDISWDPTITNLVQWSVQSNAWIKIGSGDGTGTGSGGTGADGSPGADGIGNIYYDGVYVPGSTYNTNTIVTFQTDLFYSGTNSGTLAQPDTGQGQIDWSIFLLGGSDGDDGLDGVALSFKGSWSNNMSVTTNDIISDTLLGWLWVPKGNYSPSAPQPAPDPVTSLDANYFLFLRAPADGATGNLITNSQFVGDWDIGVPYPSNSIVV